MKKTVLIFFLTAIVVSCEKETPAIIENTDIPLISKVLVDGDLYYEYTYNEANLISEEKSKFFYTSHIYGTDNRLLKSDYYVDPGIFSSSMEVLQATLDRKEWVNPDNTEKSLTTSFEYDSKGKLIRKTYTRPSAAHSEFSEFTWENDKITKVKMYRMDELSGYVDYEYDDKGNLTKQDKYMLGQGGSPVLWACTEYEYDDMNNPYQSFKRLITPGKYTNRNNIIKEQYTVYTEDDPEPDNISIVEYLYEYNEQGYPVRVNGDVEYVYK